MGLLYFEVEAKYDELIRLRREVDGLEHQMRIIGQGNLLNLNALQDKYTQLTDQLRTLTQEAAINAANMQRAYSGMSKASTGLTQSTSTSVGNARSLGKAMQQSAEEAVDVTDTLKDALNGVNQGLGRIISASDGLGATIGTAFGVGAIAAFIKKVQEVRTYFQDIESSMRVFLGDAEKADKFTSELKDYAYYNMFEFSDLANGAKQLIAYGNATEQIIPIMDKLSNVATGTGASLNELIFLYNKAKSTGRVMARDVQSWAAKGVVLRDELKAMGVEASSGAITFNQLNQVLERVTGEGGRFHDLMMEQMDNLSASKGQLADSMDAMYNEIGEKIQPLLKGMIDVASWAAENYETVGKSILTLVTTLGIYRTVLGIVNATERQELATAQASLAVLRGEATSVKDAIALKGKETQSRRAHIDAIYAEIAAEKAQVVATQSNNKRLVDILTASITAEEKIQTNLSGDFDKLLKTKQGLNSQIGSQGKIRVVDRDIKANRDEMEQSVKRMSDLKAKLADANSDLEASSKRVQQIEELEKNATNGVTQSVDLLAGAKAKLKGLATNMKAVLTNPYFYAAAVVAGLIVGIYKLATAKTEEEKAYDEVNDKMEAYNKHMADIKDEASGYINTIKDTTKTLFEQADAYEKLIELYPSLNKLSKTELSGMEIEDIMEKVNEEELNSRTQYILNGIKTAEADIARLKDSIKERQSEGANYMEGGRNTAAMYDLVSLSEELRNAEGRLQAFQEQRQKYDDAIKESQRKALTHEDRMTALTSETQVARKRVELYSDMAEKFKAIQEDSTLTTEEKTKESIAFIQEQKTELQDTKDKLKEDNEKNPIIFGASFESAEKLDGELETLITTLQNKLDDTPLEFAFGDLDYDIDTLRGTYQEALKGAKQKAQRRVVRDFGKEFSRILNDTTKTEEERASAIDALYNSTIVDLSSIAEDMDKGKKRNDLMALIKQLKTDQRERATMFNKGGAVGLIQQQSAEASKGLKDALSDENNEMKKYESYVDRRNAAATDYNASLKAYTEIQNRSLRGEKVNTEELKNKKEALDTAKKSYEEIIKEGTKYAKFIESQIKLEREAKRRNEDLLYSIEDEEVKAMKEGSDKSLAQLRLNFKKRNTEIERAYEDLKEKEIDIAEKAYNDNPDNVGPFDRQAARENYVYTEEQTLEMEKQRQTNLIEFIRKTTDISKEYQTDAEKKAERRIKVEKDIKAIDLEIAAIRASITESTREEGEDAISKLQRRLELAKQLRDTLGYDQDRVDYYKAYGTVGQKRMATEEEYRSKIADAKAQGNTYRAKSLEREMQKSLDALEIEVLKDVNNWALALDEFGDVMPSYVQAVKKSVEDIISSPKFSSMSPEEQKALHDIYRKLIDKAGASFNNISFKRISDESTRLQNILDEKAQWIEKEAILQSEIIKKYGSIDALLEKAKNGDLDAKGMQVQYENVTNNIENLTDEQHRTEENLGQAATDATTALTGFANALSKLNSNSLADIWQGLQGVAKSLNLGELGGKWGGIIGAILSIIDMLKERGLGEIIDNILTLIGDVFEKLMDELTSGELVARIADGLANLVGSILKGVIPDAKKSIDEWFKTGAQAFDELVDKTNKLSAAMGNAIDILTKRLEEGSSEDAVAAYNKAIEYNKELITQQQQLLEQWLTANQRGKLGTFFNGELTNYDTWLNNLDATYRRNLSDAFGVAQLDFSKAVKSDGTPDVEMVRQLTSEYKSNIQTALINLGQMTKDEIEDFIAKHPDIWSVLPNDYKNYINAIIEIQQQEDELTKKFAERMLNVSFDSMYSNFCNTMMDMEKTSYDTAGDISKIFYEAFAEELFDNQIKGRMEKLYADMSQLASEKNNGRISESEYQRRLQKIKEDYKALSDESIALRDTAAEVTGYSDTYQQSQSATTKGFQAMTQEQGSELNGRFTALQIAGEQIRASIDNISVNQLPNLTSKLETLIANIGGGMGNSLHNIVVDVQNMMSQSLVALMGIQDNTANVLALFDKEGYMRNAIDTIKKNTEGLRK